MTALPADVADAMRRAEAALEDLRGCIDLPCRDAHPLGPCLEALPRLRRAMAAHGVPRISEGGANRGE